MIFWNYDEDKEPEHVGIYVGNGEVVHSLGTKKTDRGCLKSSLESGKILDGNTKKVTILNDIDKELVRRNTYQGSKTN